MIPGSIQVLEGALWQSGIPHQALKSGGALRHIGSVFQQQGVAGRKLRSQDPGYLVIGEVPGFNGQQDPKRFIDQQRFPFGGIGHRQFLRCQQSLGMLGIVFEDLRRQFYFGLGLSNDFTHLWGQQLCIAALAVSEQGCSPIEYFSLVGKRGIAPTQKGLVGRFNCLCDFGISGIGKFFDELSREGIDRCICHVFLPALQVIGY